ncbi:MAG: hypothetical protein ABIF12_01915 [bacterium]
MNKSLIYTFKKFVQTNKKLTFSILLFLLVFILMAIPYKNWWFFGADDFHALFEGYKIKTFKDLFYCFYDGNIAKGAGPSNYILPTGPSYFFSTFYRPLYLVYFGIQYWLFGSCAYPYFVVNVFFHAINVVILFNIFAMLINYFPALLLALLFAFHPQISYVFGAIVNLHYYINLMLMLLSILAFKKFLDDKKLIFNLIAIFLFILSLFTRETSVVLPAIVFGATYLYQNRLNKIGIKNFFKQFKTILKLTSGYWLSSIGFLGIRLYLFPLKFPSQKNSISFYIQIKQLIIDKIPEFKVFIYDMFSLSWLPWNHKIIRGTIIISLFSIMGYLFIKNKKKIEITFLFFSAFLMLWPSLLGHYNSRYIYEAYPLIFLAFIFLFKYSKINFNPIKKYALTIFTGYIIFLGFFLTECFIKREIKYKAMKIAVEQLIQNPKIKNKALCFFGYPTENFGEQNADIFWVLLNNPSLDLYFDPATAITQADSNLIQDAGWRNVISDFHDKNYFKITPIKNGFRFESLNPQKVHFNMKDSGYSLGEKIINKTEIVNDIEVVTEFDLFIDQKYLNAKPVFIQWNYETKDFEILKSAT